MNQNWNDDERYQVYDDDELYGACNNMKEVYEYILDETTDGLTDCWDEETGLIWNTCTKEWHDHDLDDQIKVESIVCVPSLSKLISHIEKHGRAFFIPRLDLYNDNIELNDRAVPDGYSAWLIIDTLKM